MPCAVCGAQDAWSVSSNTHHIGSRDDDGFEKCSAHPRLLTNAACHQGALEVTASRPNGAIDPIRYCLERSLTSDSRAEHRLEKIHGRRGRPDCSPLRASCLSWDADRRAANWIDRPFIERFLSFLPRGATVLDLGCGGGSPVAVHMVAKGFRLTGLDSSPTLIALCRTRMPDQEWIVGDMRSFALGRRFDAILAWDSFFHLRHRDQERMFRVFAAHAARRHFDVQRRPRPWRSCRRVSRWPSVSCEPRRLGISVSCWRIWVSNSSSTRSTTRREVAAFAGWLAPVMTARFA